MSSSPITLRNAGKQSTWDLYPEFFAILRTSPAYAAYENTFNRFEENNESLMRHLFSILEKEKKKLMKELKPFKNICKQPGLVFNEFAYSFRRLHRQA